MKLLLLFLVLTLTAESMVLESMAKQIRRYENILWKCDGEVRNVNGVKK